MAQHKDKYNPTNVGIILKALEECNTKRTAYQLAGVAESTFYEWLKEKPEFKAAVERAEAVALETLVLTIKKASIKDWRAALELLKRRGGEEWQEKTRTDITSGDEKIEFTIDLGRTINETDEEM